jgi:hypothetical protein
MVLPNDTRMEFDDYMNVVIRFGSGCYLGVGVGFAFT